MPRKKATSLKKPIESFVATLRLRGQGFRFRMFTRPLQLGDYGIVQYYWLDGSQFRHLKSDASRAAFQSVVGFWKAAMCEMGVWDELDQQMNYVVAHTYGLVTRSKGLQAVYRDAYLKPGAINIESLSLPEDLRARIHVAVSGRDRFRVQEQLEQTLGRFEPPARMMPLLQEACRHWVGRGVTLMRQEQDDGLEKFLKEADYWLSKYRKRSDRWVRHFINLFAYESKIAFYSCYANAWVGLIPWLREHRGLDPLSERFLAVWHNQNQPIEIPHGRTLGGILYPTQHGVAVVEGDPNGVSAPGTVICNSEHIGPTHVPDVFSGQVLSLHPLSGFFMTDPALCAIAGRYFATGAYDLVQQGQADSCGEYWEFIGAILSAAALYRQELDRQAHQRGVQIRGGADQRTSTDNLDDNQAAILEDYATARGHRCSACQGALRLRDFMPAEQDDAAFVANFVCSVCERALAITIGRADLTAWLLRKLT